MARPKRPPPPMVKVAGDHLGELDSALRDEPIHLRMLDGPPGAPRYAVYVGTCERPGPCPHGVEEITPCPVLNCALRHSLRMLLDRDGNLVEVLRGGVRWTS
ncbi:MAG TPA: hypothetical protein PKD53_09360 [Chloroflexaceae bacterium]|nr:hypothetical protein [Chloroflexaceae bacterium]